MRVSAVLVALFAFLAQPAAFARHHQHGALPARLRGRKKPRQQVEGLRLRMAVQVERRFGAHLATPQPAIAAVWQKGSSLNRSAGGRG